MLKDISDSLRGKKCGCTFDVTGQELTRPSQTLIVYPEQNLNIFSYRKCLWRHLWIKRTWQKSGPRFDILFRRLFWNGVHDGERQPDCMSGCKTYQNIFWRRVNLKGLTNVSYHTLPANETDGKILRVETAKITLGNVWPIQTNMGYLR